MPLPLPRTIGLPDKRDTSPILQNFPRIYATSRGKETLWRMLSRAPRSQMAARLRPSPRRCRLIWFPLLSTPRCWHHCPSPRYQHWTSKPWRQLRTPANYSLRRISNCRRFHFKGWMSGATLVVEDAVHWCHCTSDVQSSTRYMD